jgi:hypothetical protein
MAIGGDGARETPGAVSQHAGICAGAIG